MFVWYNYNFSLWLLLYDRDKDKDKDEEKKKKKKNQHIIVAYNVQGGITYGRVGASSPFFKFAFKILHFFFLMYTIVYLYIYKSNSKLSHFVFTLNKIIG